MDDDRLSELKQAAARKAGNGIPVYVKIKESIHYCISNYKWRKGEYFGRADDIAKIFGVTRITVKQALRSFIESGILVSKRGKGLFMNCDTEEPPRMSFKIDMNSYLRAATNSAITVLDSQKTTTCPWDLAEFRHTPNSYQHMIRIHEKSGSPYVYLDAYFDFELFDLSPRLFSEEIIFTAIEKLKPGIIARAFQRITIARVNSTIANLLKISTDSPVAIARRVALDKNDKLLYIGFSTYPGDRVQFDIDIGINNYI